MIKTLNKKEQKKKQWCPMEGTEYEGFCVENFATIRVKGPKCDHNEYCNNLKKELDKSKEENTK